MDAQFKSSAYDSGEAFICPDGHEGPELRFLTAGFPAST